MAEQHGAILTVAPERVFLRLRAPVCEMAPEEAMRLACGLIDAANRARAATDGAALLTLFKVKS
jgi:hypothetical protein